MDVYGLKLEERKRKAEIRDL